MIAAFEHQPTVLKGLSAADLKTITGALPLDLDLELAGAYLTDEDYWRRRAELRWGNSRVDAHGKSWKQLFFELNLQVGKNNNPCRARG